MKRHLNIIARSNGVGLDRDVDLVRLVNERTPFTSAPRSPKVGGITSWKQ